MIAPAKLAGTTAIWVETTGIIDHLAAITTAVAAAAVETAVETAVATVVVEVAVATAAVVAETAAAEIADGDARHAETRTSPPVIDRQSRETSYMLVSLGDWNHE